MFLNWLDLDFWNFRLENSGYQAADSRPHFHANRSNYRLDFLNTLAVANIFRLLFFIFFILWLVTWCKGPCVLSANQPCMDGRRQFITTRAIPALGCAISTNTKFPSNIPGKNAFVHPNSRTYGETVWRWMNLGFVTIVLVTNSTRQPPWRDWLQSNNADSEVIDVR